VPLVKLRQFQDLGHQAVLIIGDFTALIGDPSGRSTTRPVLSRPEIEANARTFAEQVFKILDRQRTEVRHNGEWLSKLSLEDVVRLTAGMTVARMLERHDVRQRYAAGTAMRYYDLLSRAGADRREGVRQGRVHPMEAKKALAAELVERFHGRAAAESAAEFFEERFQKRTAHRPKPVRLATEATEVWICQLMKDVGFAPSTSEARRLVAQGAVKVDGRPVGIDYRFRRGRDRLLEV